METKHTPGPWSHTPMQDTVWTNDGQTKICSIADLPWKENPVTGRRSSDSDTEMANARLIAAAPDLIQALIDLVSPYGQNENPPTSVKLALGAIAKATGTN